LERIKSKPQLISVQIIFASITLIVMEL